MSIKSADLASIARKVAALDVEVPSGQNLQGHAAVLLALTDEPDPRVVLTKRAHTLSTHSGEVSFPGGKWDREDGQLHVTALREAEEEIGLRPDQVNLLGPLWPRTTRWQVNVTPWVGVVPPDVKLVANECEIDAIFSVPISYLLSDPRIRTDRVTIDGRRIYMPAFEYRGYEIWGFTAGVLTEFMVHVLGADIGRRDDVPLRSLN